MTAGVKWIPTDDELDSVARSLPGSVAEPNRAEQARTSLLAHVPAAPQQRRRSVTPFVVAITIAATAAAAVLAVVVTRPSEPTAGGATTESNQLVTPIGAARFERVTDWPDYMVRVDDGVVSIKLAQLESSQRFRVMTGDAEVEVRGTSFVIGAHGGHLTSVLVNQGKVELRRGPDPVVVLSAGQSWPPVVAAQRDTIELQQPDGEAAATHPNPAAPALRASDDASDPATTKPEMDPAPTTIANDSRRPATLLELGTRQGSGSAISSGAGRTAAPRRDLDTLPASGSTLQPNEASKPASHPAEVSSASPSKIVSPPPTLVAVKPGEVEFRDGVSALRAGETRRAMTAFASACGAARSDALGEDACFWAGAAAKRAGETATARDAFVRFVQRFPRSGRTGEAAALLGWIFYEAGDLDSAEHQFEQAVGDQVPKVRDSAERGREAIKRRRSMK